MYSEIIISKFYSIFFLLLLITIRISYEITIGEFTITNINDLLNGNGGKFFPSYSPTNEYFQLCLFNDQKGTGPWDYAPQVNVSQKCYNKVLSQNAGATEILIYKFFRLRNSTELEPGNLKVGITKVYEVYYQFIYFKNGDIDETTQIDIETICEENIFVSYLPTMSDTLKTQFLTVYDQNPKTNKGLEDLQDYDILNPNSNFYKSICTIYTYNTYLESFILKESLLNYYDVSLEMRKLYFPGAAELCPVTCDYIGIMDEDKKLLIVCKCDDQHFDLLGGTIPQFQTFSSVYFDEEKFNNTNKDNYFTIDVLKCFRNTMLYALSNNYGSYIILGIWVVIFFAFGAIFLWGKGRIISIFELIYNNNINSLNYIKNQDENSYNNIHEGSHIFSDIKENKNPNINSRNKKDDIISYSSSKGGLNYMNNFHQNSLTAKGTLTNINNNNIIEQNRNEQENKKIYNNENEENEEINEEYEEEEDDELANPPKKIIIKKKKIKIKKKKNNENQNYEQSPNNMQEYGYENNEKPEQNYNYPNNNQAYDNYHKEGLYQDEGHFNEESRKQLNKNVKKYNNQRENEEYTNKDKESESIHERQVTQRPSKKKRSSKIKKEEKKETEETNNEDEYIPDIIKTKIVIPIDNIFTDQELNNMDLEEIYQYDQRTFFDIYFSILNIKCPIFFLFTYYNSTKGISLPLQIKYPGIKLIIFCILIFICFFFNATAFGSKSISFRLKGTYGFGKNIAFATILAPFCLILYGITNFFVFFKVTKKIVSIKIKLFTSFLMKKGEETKDINFNSLFEEGEDDIHRGHNNSGGYENYNEEEIIQKDIKEERLKLKTQILDLFSFIRIRLFITIGCMVVILLFIWYYVAAFCACYRNTQVTFLLNVLLTFIFCNIIPCFYCFLPTWLRKLAVERQDSKILICYKISQII